MNHCVPDFEMGDDHAIPTTSSGFSRPRKLSMPEDDIMELLWQDGQVVMQSQNQRSSKKSQPSKYHIDDAVLPTGQSTAGEIVSSSSAAPPHQQQPEDVSAAHLFMQEDEMASWLHYPLDDTSFDRDFCSDLLYPPPSVTATTASATTTATASFRTNPPPPPLASAAARPPMPPMRRTTDIGSSRFHNFVHFSRVKGMAESEFSDSNKVVKEATVVDSNETSAIGQDSRVSQAGEIGNTAMCAAVGGTTSSAGRGSREVMMTTCDMTMTSSPGGSGASASASASAEPVQRAPVEDRKRKARQIADDTEYHSEDVEFDPVEEKKQVRGSTSTKRSRAAEVHNLSERRRRDRINEKMKALQELIPRCNKSDKASMLDEAIEYLKSLQLQVQMMSMGCSMVPMMFPGVQQYMLPMGMGMGMGMGMEMGMSRPMLPFPSVLAGSALPTPAASAHLGPRFPMPAFHMQPVHAHDPSRMQATNQSESMLHSLAAQNPNQSRVPNFADSYQQYFGLHKMQLPLPQNQVTTQPSTSKPSTSRGVENLEHHQSG